MTDQPTPTADRQEASEPPRRERTWSRITLELDVAHNGDPQAVAEHLAVDVEATLRRVGITVMDGPSTSAEVVRPGDAQSAALPAWA